MATTLLLHDGDPIDTAHFEGDPAAYAATLAAMLRPHLGTCVIASHPRGQTHLNVVHAISEFHGWASLTSLSLKRTATEHRELLAIGVHDGTFLPQRDLIRFFGDRTINCLTCSTPLQQHNP